MNWLGLSLRVFVSALFGAVLGGVAYGYALLHRLDAPYLVGLGTGLGAFVAAPDKSGMRGLLLATLAIWAAWAVQARIGPYAGAGLVHFHDTLTWKRYVGFFACGVAAFVLARSSIRRDADHRLAGS